MNKKRPKNIFSQHNYNDMVILVFNKDNNMFVHEYNQVQTIFATLLFYCSGVRIRALVPDTSKVETRGLWWKVRGHILDTQSLTV